MCAVSPSSPPSRRQGVRYPQALTSFPAHPALSCPPASSPFRCGCAHTALTEELELPGATHKEKRGYLHLKRREEKLLLTSETTPYFANTSQHGAAPTVGPRSWASKRLYLRLRGVLPLAPQLSVCLWAWLRASVAASYSLCVGLGSWLSSYFFLGIPSSGPSTV